MSGSLSRKPPGRFFLDTNVFVYSFDPSDAQKRQAATELVGDGLASQKGVVSYQVVQEFFNVALRRFSQPMQTAEAEQYLNVVFRPLLRVHSSQSLYGEALHLQDTNYLSWYDSLIVASAIQAECDVLYSEDFQHGQRFGSLRVVNPFL